MRTFTVHQVEQRSEQWRQLRAGRLTGSEAGALLAERKRGTGELAVRRDLRRRLVVERLTGYAEDSAPIKSRAMQHGVDTERAAFRAYEAKTGQLVTTAGFLAHNELAAGVSLDGYVGDFTGVIELKCPTSLVHLDYLEAGVLPDDYRGQVIHALWMTGAAWCDFVSFDDRLPAGLQLFVHRVQASSIDLKAYELLVRMFLTEVERDQAAIEQLATLAVA